MDTTDNPEFKPFTGDPADETPEFKPFTNDFTEEEALKRRARAIAASKNLFRTDISKLDDAQVSGLYQATARALFQIEDPDGKVAFGKKAGDARTNVGLLRDFCKGNYKLIRDDEYETWRAMDEEQRFRHALENEGAENKAKSYFQRRGLSISDLAGAGMPGAQFGNVLQNAAAPGRDEVLRKQNYENLTPEEQAVYRKDVIEDYEKKLSKRQVLATYLAMTDGLSDRASMLLAKAYNTGTVDVKAMEALPQKERDQAYTALSIMRGDQKKGHILGIPTDFTDDTAANRLQLCLYGFQQGVLGLIPDTYELGKDITKAAYAKFCLDDAERKRYIDRWDAQVRMEQALKQGLPEAESWWGAGFQGAAESFALMVPYLGIGKAGKMMRAATAVSKDASWLKRTATMLNPLRAGSRHRARAKLVEGVKAVEEADYADTFARLSQWKTVGGGDLTVGNQLLARQLANIENYTRELRELKKLSQADLAKWGLGAASWASGEATAFGSFAKEYVETCDAAGISRYDSVPMAAVVGLVNAQIEHLYVPGLESTMTASEVKSLTVGALLQAMKADGAKGFRQWLANRAERGVVEGVKVAATEGTVEEPLQQIVIEHGKAIAETAGKLRENGQGDLADRLSAYWDATKDTFAKDFQTFVETAVDSLPSSVVFGATTVGNQTRRQHLHNIMTRHENRAKYAREVERAKAEGRDIPAPPVMLSKAEDGSLRFNSDGVDYDAGIADMIGRAAATQKAVTDYWAGDGQGREGEDVRFANALAAARKAWDDGEGDTWRKIADAAQVDMRTAEVIAEYFIAEDKAKLHSPQLRAFADYSLSAAGMSEKTLERILPGYVKGSYRADERNGVYSGQVKLEDGSVKTIAYKVGDISEELMKAAEDQIKDDSELGDSHDERIRSGAERGEKLWARMSEQERYAYALRGVNALAGGSGVIEMTDADGNVSRISADDIIYLSNGRFGDVGYGPMANLGTARHETWHAIWRFTKATFTEDERRKLADKLGVDVSDPKWERKLDEAMAYQFELYASGAHVPHVATGAIDRLMQSTAAKWIGELSKFGLADEVKNAKTGKAFALADFYDAVMRGEIGTGRLGIAQVATETPPQKAAEPQKKTRKELPVGVSEEELAEAERAAAEAAAGTAPETTENGKPVSENAEPVSENAKPESVNAAKTDYTLDSPANASVPDARFYRISAGDGVDLVGELVVSDARDLKTSYKGNLSDPSLQNRAETNEGRSLVEKIAGSPDPLQVGTVQPRANNGFVWTTPSLDTFIGNTRESGISAAYEKGNAAAVRAYMLAEAAKRGIEVPEGIGQPIVHFVLRRIESKDGKASIQDVVRMTNQSVNRGMNVYEQAKNDADVLVGAGLVPHIALRPDGRIDTAKSAEAIGRFIQETGAQGMVDENTDSLTEDGQARLQNAVLAALLGNENADTVAKMMREADRLDIENEKRSLMKTAAELMRIAAAKPQYDLRQPLAEALDYYLNWRDVDERKREEAGKNRHDWYERTKDGEHKRGLTWSMHMGQGDMFRTPSPEARLLGDLLAASRDLRSFDAEDRETDAGKKRAQGLVTTFIGDYIRNADAVNTETVDLLGTPPPSRIELLETHRGTNASRRFSTVVSPTLREDVEAAINTDRTKGEIVKGEKRVVFCDTPGLLQYVGMPNAKIYSKAYALRKIVNDHKVTADQITGAPELMNHPAAVFDDNGQGYVVLTDVNVPDANGILAPMMIYLHPDAEGNYLASAYSRTEKAEAKYTNLANAGKILYWDKNKVADLALRGEALSSLSTFSIGDDVVTPERVTAESIAKSAADDNDVRFSVARRLEEEREAIEAKGGELLLAHHGTDSRGFTRFEKSDDIGYFFAKSRNTAASYIRHGRRGDENKPGIPYYTDVLTYLNDEASGYTPEEVGAMSYEEKVQAYVEGTGEESGVYDVALKMEDPYRIDCHGANWNAIYEIPDGMDQRTYDRVILEFDPDVEKFKIMTREYSEDGDNELETVEFDDFESFKKNLAENMGDTFAMDELEELAQKVEDGEYAMYEPIDGRQEKSEAGAMWTFDAMSGEGWGIYPKRTREIVEDAQNMGCDGVIFYNVVDNGGGIREADADDVYVVMKSEQVKSVDSMTYADDGSIIPAEKRFDWSNPDIRFSTVSTDTPEFKAWFGDSKVVDADGRPLKVYRGSPYDPLKQPAGKGVIKPEAYFTADPEYARRYGKVNAYYLRMRKPFDIRNDADAARLREFYPQGYQFAVGRNGALDWGEMANFDLDELREKYPEYDGIILDKGGDPQIDGSVKDRGVSYVPFDGGAQVKSATDNIGAFDPANPDIRYSTIAAAISDESRRRRMDAEHADAVKRGDMATASRMVREAAEKAGYVTDSSYQGTSAFNGAAPSANGYFANKEERKAAWEDGSFEDTQTLGDYIFDGIDISNFDFILGDERYRRNATPERQEAVDNLRGVLSAKGKKVRMYRSVPSDVKEESFRNGDWITPSRSYAEENARIHGWGDKFRIIEQDVSVEDVWWDGNDIAEWGFDDGKEYTYRNTKNNRKLLAPATYDNAGKLIPLSKRFDPANPDIRFSTVQIEKNVDEMLSKLDEAKGKSKEEIFKQYDFHQKVIAQLPLGMVLPESVSVSNPVVKCAQNYLLAHLVVNDAEHHDVKITAEDAKRIIGLIDTKNEMRLVKQRGSHSIAFIGRREDGTWDCICIAPKRGEYYVFKTMFAQKKKPYQDKSLIRFSVVPELGQTLGPDITGGTPRPDATSIRGASTTAESIAHPAEKGNAPRRSFSTVGLYTGSAADYAKPSLLKVGTGEGSQVYGWGLYASSERGVADMYAAQESGKRRWTKEDNIKRRMSSVSRTMDYLEKRIESTPYMESKPLRDQFVEASNRYDELKKQLEALPRAHVYEQTFFTNRPEGDESHLLKWYGPVSRDNAKRIVDTLRHELPTNGLFAKMSEADWTGMTGEEAYKLLAEELEDPSYATSLGQGYRVKSGEQAASEFLARADIDGIKYPVDSYGKTVKDGDTVGWNYVSFRDDNIRVDHKWVDGQQRFSTVQIEKNVDEILSKLDEAKGKSKDEIFKQYDNEQKIIGALPDDINLPEALKVADPVVKAAQAYMLDHLLNQPGHEFAYDADDAKRVIGLINPRNEMRVVQQRNSSSLAFIGNNPKGGWDCIVIAPRRGEFYVFKTMFGQTRKPYQDKVRVRYSFGSSVRNEAVGSLLRGRLASIRDVDQTAESIAHPAEKGNAPRRSFSTVGSAYPALNRLSDEQLIAVALASKTVFGKAGKKQSQHFTINEVQRHIKALHPDWDGPKVSLESTRIYQLVRPIKAKLQEDIQRGVSQSNILRHLPERLKEEFGSEMTQQARTGARIGTAHQQAVSLLEGRKVKVVEDAVRVQSGVASQILENQYGIDLSRTLMNLADNPALKKDGQGNYLPPDESGSAPDGKPSGAVDDLSAEKAVDEKVKKAVTEIVGKTQDELDRSEANRRSLSDQRGRDAEREAELAGEANEGTGLDPADGDIVGIATRKAGVDLQNPRHLALFVTELARRHWVKEHGLAEDAEAFKDAVALQFLRKTAQDVYGKLVRDITYSQSRDSATAAINGFEHVPTLRGLISEMTFAGQLINARKIRETAQGMCEKLDTFLREKFGAAGRFKPDNEELRRKVSTEMELRARYARHAIWLTPNAAGKEADLLQKEIDAAATDFDREDHDAEQSRVMIENIRKINILREFGGLRYKPLAQIQSALEYWDNAQQGEADQIGRENLEREIRTKKAAEVLAKAFRNPKMKYAKDGKALASAIDNYITGHMGFTHLLRDMMRYASKEDAAAAETILQYLELEIQKGGTRVMTQKRRHADALAKAVQQIYGRNFSKVLAEFCKEDGRFAEFMGETDGKKDMPTKGRAMQLMVSLLQVGRQVEVIDETDPERKKTKLEWQGGYHDNIVKHHREAQAAKIAALLSPQDLQLVKWLGNWYDTNRQELSSVCRDLFGIGVYAETSNYMPVKMRLDAQGLEKGEAVGWTIFPKALMPRVRNERDFDTRADILQMFMARMEEGEQWKAHAKLGLEMRGIFGRSELQASVIASHGTKANALMLGFVTDILAGQGARQRAASGDVVENYTDWIRGWAALGALGGNVGVTLKQTTSIPAFGFEVGLVKTGRYMLSAFTPDGLAAMKKIWDSDERRNRWNVGNSEAVANALAGNDVGALKRLMRASMVTNKVGDSVPALVCGQGIYRDCIEQGMDEEDAMAKTWMLIERTQQSGRVENQAGFQRRTKFGRALYQFLTTQQQYLSYEARAIRSVMAKPGDLGRWGKLGETLVLNHFLLSSAYFWMGQLYKRLLGQEPDEDGELADWMVSCLLGPYGALYGLGITTTEAINTWVKGRKFGTQGQLPSLSWASNFIVHDPARLVGACFSDEKTFDDVLDAAAKWASDSNAIFRDLRKVYRWRVKKEPQ